MNALIQFKKASSIFLALAFICGLSPVVRAVTPAPDGCYPNFTTAEGCDALNSLTTGAGNTALGWRSLFFNTDGGFNTGVGAGALVFNNGTSNTAVGTAALLLNTTGTGNTAVGTDAMVFNATGPFNTAVGYQALANATANANVAVGDLALDHVTSGFFNTAIGPAAGDFQTTGHNNVYIGQGSFGVAGENNTCYIQGIAGSSIPTANAAFVFVDTMTGQLATMLVNADGSRVIAPISQGQLQAVPPGKYEPVPHRSLEDGRQAILNESLEQKKRIAVLENTVEHLSAMVNEQAAQIRKVSAQLEISKPVTKLVVSTH